MSKDVNKVVLTGRLVQDIELRYTGSGTAVTDMRIAVNRSIKKGDEWIEQTAFVSVTLWGKRAERISEACSKGSFVYVDGHLKEDTWDDKTTGKKRSRLMVESENVKAILPDTTADSGRPAAGAPAPAEPGLSDDDIPF